MTSRSTILAVACGVAAVIGASAVAWAIANPSPSHPAATIDGVTTLPRASDGAPPNTRTVSPGAIDVPSISASISGSVKATATEATGGIAVNPSGAILPDPNRTPGALNPAVTQATINTTICVTGWSTSVRPPSSYTTALKRAQLASGYAYRGDTATADYEEDHLISLEIGGSPTSELNLWPEPYNATDGAHVKDVIENRLHALVCAGQISLASAQRAISTNWWTAYLTYVGDPPTTTTIAPGSPPPTHSVTTHAVAPPPAISAPAPPSGATALCNDGTYSYAAGHQGACSHHDGVAVFYH